MSEERISQVPTRPAASSSGPGVTSRAPGPPFISANARASVDQPPRSPPGHQRFVLADHVAFRYLEDDPSTTVLERRRELPGYELYLVEQWLCSRTHPTTVIVTYTGDPLHRLVVSVLSVPADEGTWSPRLRLYFSGAAQYRARRKETPLGALMVTNLSWFPSALTVIRVPDGDLKKHHEDVIVNEDLKRLGCSGRAGLKLGTPADATQAKFYQLYKVNDRNRLCRAVIELVQLCQLALNVFDKLGSAYADGLLCDVTERAINDWWVEIGTDFYHTEPRDGILGPTTVAAILGTLTGARNRLNAYGAPVAKDPLDFGGLKRGIASFQRSHKIPESRRLDPVTLDRLHRATARAASGEGWMVPKTVKSTMVELGGKGGEMVKGMVGARDKPGIAEVETLNYDRFVQLVRGERCKWLWYGKPRRSLEHAGAGTMSPVDDAGKNDYAGLRWRIARRGSTDVDPAGEPSMGLRDPSRTASEPIGNAADPAGDREWHLGRAALKSMTDRRNDARRGLDRIRDAVGISTAKGRHQRSATEDAGRAQSGLRSVETTDTEMEPGSEAGLSKVSTREPELSHATPFRTAWEAFRREREAEDARVESKGGDVGLSLAATSGPMSRSEPSTRRRSSEARLTGPTDDQLELETGLDKDGRGASQAISRSRSRDVEYTDGRASYEHDPRPAPVTLRRTASASDGLAPMHRRRHGSWWPRHLSFSAAEEAIFVWKDLTDGVVHPSLEQANAADARLWEECMAEEDRWKYEQLLHLDVQVAAWVRESLDAVEALDLEAMQDREQVYTLYRQCSQQYEDLLSNLDKLRPEQRSQLMTAIRDLEVSGAKLEYQINNLVAKVEDVEDGVEGIERHVESLESKAHEFDAEERARESWTQWGLRMVAGIRR